MQRICLALDLKDDPALFKEYEDYHKAVWPEIMLSITSSGITGLEIYREGNRMFMIIEATDEFSLEKKGAMDASNEKVQEWEALMWNYQQALPTAKKGEKWVIMKKIFDLNNQA